MWGFFGTKSVTEILEDGGGGWNSYVEIFCDRTKLKDEEIHGDGTGSLSSLQVYIS